jgi:hypothetical protein
MRCLLPSLRLLRCLVQEFDWEHVAPPPVSAVLSAVLHTLWLPPMSFISVEPQSRVLLESNSNSLLAQFDTQLRTISDRYLAFFEERSIDIGPRVTFHTNHWILRRSIEAT